MLTSFKIKNENMLSSVSLTLREDDIITIIKINDDHFSLRQRHHQMTDLTVYTKIRLIHISCVV
jgi:hypothetical protein